MDLVGAPRDGSAVGATLHDHLAVGPREHVVVVELETRQAVPVRAKKAEHLGARGPVGIDALHVVERVDALDARAREGRGGAVGRVGVGPSLEVGEGGVLREGAVVVARVSPEGGGQDVGRARLVADLAGVAVERLAVNARGEHVAVAVVDGAATGRDGHVARVVGVCLGGEAWRLDDLQPHEPEGDEGKQDEDAHRQAEPARALRARLVVGRERAAGLVLVSGRGGAAGRPCAAFARALPGASIWAPARASAASA